MLNAASVPRGADFAGGIRLAVELHQQGTEIHPLALVFSEEEWFTGVGRPVQGLVQNGGLSVCGLGVGNSLPVITRYFPSSVGNGRVPAGQIASCLQSFSRFEAVQFQSLPAGPLVFSSAGEGSDEAFAAARSLYAAVTFQDGRTWSIPIESSRFDTETGCREFVTECLPIPSHLTEPKRFREGMLSSQTDAESLLQKPDFSMDEAFPIQWTYLRLREDGTFLTAIGETSGGAPARYKSLSVYAVP